MRRVSCGLVAVCSLLVVAVSVATAFAYTVLPNLLVSTHPDYVVTYTIWPKAENRTEVVCEFHFHPEEMKRPGFTADSFKNPEKKIVAPVGLG